MRCSMPSFPARSHCASGRNVKCSELTSIWCAACTAAINSWSSISVRSGVSGASRRRPVAGVNGTLDCSFG